MYKPKEVNSPDAVLLLVSGRAVRGKKGGSETTECMQAGDENSLYEIPATKPSTASVCRAAESFSPTSPSPSRGERGGVMQKQVSPKGLTSKNPRCNARTPLENPLARVSERDSVSIPKTGR